MTLVAGFPEIVGGEFVATAVTVIEKAARLAESTPSETLITILESVPASPSDGVPASRPVDESKLVQDGRFEIENVSESPSSSDAVGVNEYISPISTLRGGEPEMRGGELAGVSFDGDPENEDPDSSSDKQPLKIRVAMSPDAVVRIHFGLVRFFIMLLRPLL